MSKYIFSITLVGAILICWPDLLADGLPMQLPARLTKRPSPITVVQTPEDEPLLPPAEPIVRPAKPPLSDLPTQGIPVKNKQSALPAHLAALEWRERLRQEQSTPNRKGAIHVRN